MFPSINEDFCVKFKASKEKEINCKRFAVEKRTKIVFLRQRL